MANTFKLQVNFDSNGVCVSRQCTLCKKLKLAEEFNKARAESTGIDSRCTVCKNKKRRDSIHANPEKKQKEYARSSAWVKNNRDKVKEFPCVKNRSQRTEKIRLQKKAWVKNNPDRVKATVKKSRAKNRRYVSSKKTQTPKWLTQEHKEQFKKYYVQSRELSKLFDSPFEVDHIIPLSHPDVCGLHVPWNLQIISMSENAYKNNKFDGTNENATWQETY